ncbi:MAG: accessory gene regulator B family protein [Clostridia bacterium]
MVDKISIYILDNILYKNEKIESDQREMMIFGITRIVEDIPKYLIILIISICFKILPMVGIVLGVTVAYKTFIGGAHARTNIGCLISSSIYFLAPVFISKNVNISLKTLYFFIVAIFIFSLYVIVKRAPADTEEIPIINKKKRKLFKMFAFLSLITIYIFTLTIIKSLNIKIMIFITILLIDTFATKPLYKFFNCKYSYESDEFKQYFN